MGWHRWHFHVGGRWTDGESPVHINVLELHAAKLTLLALAPNVSHYHIRLMLDNTTAAAYIDKMGKGLHYPLAMRLLCLYSIGQKTERFGYLLPLFWALRTQWQIFIPGIFGTILNGCLTLWCSNNLLPSLLYTRLTSASRLDCQLTPFVFWKPEPGPEWWACWCAQSTLGNFIHVPGVPTIPSSKRC